VGLRKEREIGFFVGERENDIWVIEREKVKAYEVPKNRGGFRVRSFQPFLKRENVLHATHHYTLGRV